MAARENQGYVIGIIVLAVLAVMLLVTTVFSMMKAYENYDNMVAARGDADFQRAVASAFENKSKMLSACLGLEGTTPSEITGFRDQITSQKSRVEGANQTNEIQQIADSAQTIYEIYEKDMAFNRAITDDGGDGADTDMTYKGTVDKMASALNSANENAFGQANEAKRIRSESQQQLATLNNTLQERTKALAKAEQEKEDEKQRNKVREEELLAQAVELQKANELMQGEFDDQKAGLEEVIATGVKDLAEKTKQNDAMKERLNEYEREVFDLPDGEIRLVAENTDSVFIDMGRLDGIRANLTFAVYDSTATDFKKDSHKAMIEVTEVIGPHSARARITESDPLNPILTRDKILSATFDRGDAVTIALGGFFDLDGDGISDLEKLKRMIVRNGGRVVASHDEDGNVTGEIDSTTRFFVLGPSPRSGARNVVNAMGTLKEQAEGNSVDTIDLRKLLNWMGVHGSARVERLDSRIGESTGFQQRSATPVGGSRGNQ